MLDQFLDDDKVERLPHPRLPLFTVYSFSLDNKKRNHSESDLSQRHCSTFKTNFNSLIHNRNDCTLHVHWILSQSNTSVKLLEILVAAAVNQGVASSQSQGKQSQLPFCIGSIWPESGSEHLQGHSRCPGEPLPFLANGNSDRQSPRRLEP